MKELVAENFAETDGRAQNVLVREVKWAGKKATDPPPSSPGGRPTRRDVTAATSHQ